MSDYNNGYDEGYRAGMQKMREVGQARIEELEAKLEKAIDFVAEVGGGFKFGESLVDWANLHVLKARTTLAELKGENDE